MSRGCEERRGNETQFANPTNEVRWGEPDPRWGERPREPDPRPTLRLAGTLAPPDRVILIRRSTSRNLTGSVGAMRTLGIGTVLLVLSTCMSEGTLLPARNVESRHLGGARTVRIYLPPSYDRAPKRRYPVLYLHDGQNVFSSAGTNCCFGWGSWDLDKTADRLIAEERMEEIIMVGVDSGRSRYKECRGLLYDSPGKRTAAAKNAPKRTEENSRFDAYAKFLTQELKPVIDREFRTRKTAAHTGVMGSSMGGIGSLALAWENPKVFGLAASLSGAFQVEKRNFVECVLQPYEGRRKPFR